MRYNHYSDPDVDIAVDLINTWGSVSVAAASDPAHDHVHDDADLATFLREHGLDDTGVTAAHEAEVRTLADRLHTAATAERASDAAVMLNAILVEAGALPQLSGHDGRGLHLHYHRADADPVERLSAIAAMGLATVLCTGGVQRLGQCDGIACRDVYVDTSRNNRRRFCSDGCANRAHVAAHRARQRGAGA